MYDLNLIPINFIQGKLSAELLGFYAAGPPRRPARGRGDDLLILSMSFGGSLNITPQTQHAWLAKLTDIFYKSAGSVTAAMRTVIETLNVTLMEKNLQSAQGGGALTGAINLAVLHRQYLYIAQSGMTHAFIVSRSGFEHDHDAQKVDRGLGLSRTPVIRYFQTDLTGGGYLIFTDTPPEDWNENVLKKGAFPTLDQLRRRVMAQAPEDFKAGLVEITSGSGRINLVRPVLRTGGQSASATSQTEEDPVGRRATRPQAEPPKPVENLRVRDLMSQTAEQAADLQDLDADQVQTRGSGPASAPKKTPQISQEQAEKKATPFSAQKRAPQSAAPVIRPEPILPGGKKDEKKTDRMAAVRQALQERKDAFGEKGLHGLAKFLDGWRRIRESVSTFFRDLAARWSPKDAGGLPGLSRSTMLFIAVAVPLVVVALAVGVYLARGREQQYNYYYEQAVAAADQAIIAETSSEMRSGWVQTLILLEQAETYRKTESLETLRQQAQEALDFLDGATRLAYQPAIIGTLYSGINIDRIVSLGPDLYLFDSQAGQIIHALRTSAGYEVDADFTCQAGQYNNGYVDDLVDMVGLPINNFYQAHVLGIDGRGNLIFCSSDQDPVVMSLPAPEGSQGQISRMAYDNGSLYVLDPISSMILVYNQETGQFIKPPLDYFDGVPLEERPDLSTIVDLAVNGPELFLLREDGLLARCVSSGIADVPVGCTNPVAYEDARPGKEGQSVVMPESTYDSLIYTAPPDPSLFLLEAINADIYRFSVRLKLVQRLRPDLGEVELNVSTATAFTVGIDRIAFIAFGNQVFYAVIE